ncbi:MAG TPA: VCBS repeat-containing protein, partial [Planctomycetota bacterium]|nr:VCBS repeat-containing protein [Planctomycetota bacterium]
MQIARTLALAAVPVLYAAPAGAQFVFEPPTYAAAGGQSHDPSLDAGDLDGDGAPDLVLSLESDEDGYRVLLNDGAGAFQAASTVATPDALLMLRLADVDEDGALDLLSTGLDGIQMRLGQGDGSFGSAALIFAPAPGHAEYLALAELTADRHLDLIVLGDGNVTLLPGHGDGSFGPAQQIASLAQHAYAVRTGDLDNDGVTDLLVVAATKVFPQILISVAWSFLGTAGGSFAAGVPHFLADQADTELLDVSGDGVPDLVFTSSLGVGTRSGLGNGSFGPTKVVQAGLFATG